MPFSVAECVSSAVDLVATDARTRGLRLTTRIDDTVPAQLIGDITRIRQILSNLLTNAVKFTHEGEVAVTVKGHETAGNRYELRFAVADTGIGIAVDKIHRVFRSFTQADASMSRKYGGTGLGLAISRRLTELMGGRIWFESREGEGSTFFFTVRTQLLDDAIDQPRTEETGEHGLDHTLARRFPLQILLAEDHPVNQRVASLLLRGLGYEETVASNGREAIDAIEREAFDVVLMDVQMPELDGLEAARAICSRWPCSQRPWIVAMTASTTPEDRERCRLAGMDDFVAKPVMASELRQVLIRASETLRDNELDAAEAAPTEPDDSSLELRVLESLYAFKPAAVEELVSTFVTHASEQIEALRRAVAKEDEAAIATVAHSLKGSSGSLGALRMARFCAQLEGPSQSASSRAPTFAALDREFRDVRRALEQQMQIWQAAAPGAS